MLAMIVDGNVERRSSISAMLSSEGYSLLSAANRTEAIGMLGRTRLMPRMIFLDPECGGESASNFLSAVLKVAPKAKMFLLTTPAPGSRA